MPYYVDPLARSQSTARSWLRLISEYLGDDDPRFAYRVTRVWLQMVRDRLSVVAAAHFAAQLPEVLRGAFYEGWKPSRIHSPCDADAFGDEFATRADLYRADVPRVAAAIGSALSSLLSDGQFGHVLAVVPDEARLTPHADSRLAEMEQRLSDVREALLVLVRGLEESPSRDTTCEQLSRATEHAHRILLAGNAGMPDRHTTRSST